MRCKFCHAQAVITCSVPHPDRLILEPCELQPGMRVQRPLDLAFYTVLAVHMLDVCLAQLEPPDRRRRPITTEFRWTLPVLIETQLACGNPACEFHAREIDDGFWQCAEHWPDFEKVYSVE